MALPAGTTVINGFALTPDGALYVTTDPASPITGTVISASTAFRAPDGSISVTGYGFTGAVNTGWIRTGGNIGYSIAGVFGGTFAAASWLSAGVGGTDLGSAAASFKRLYVDYTNTGTVGAVTINKAAGRVNIAGAGTSVVVTNSLVTAASHVMAVMSTADATGRVTSVVPAAGSFTINTVAVTAQASFDFFVISAD